MRKTLIIGALAFVLGGGAVFIYLKHSAHSNSYATMHEMHHGKSGGASQGLMQGHMHDEMTMPGLQGKDTTENFSEIGDFSFGGVFALHAGHVHFIIHMPPHHTLGGRARFTMMHFVHVGVGIGVAAFVEIDKHRSAAQNEGQRYND